MIYKSKGIETKQKVLIHLFTASLVLHQGYDSAFDLLLVLFRYSFLLTDTPSKNNFSKRHFPNHGAPSTPNPNGARYLNPKYSRWISTDSALSAFVSGNSSGSSGGIYNPTNLNLYHYGNNNPIKYVDPDGRDWLCRTVDDVQEYFYRADITTNEQARKEYGNSAFVLFNGYEFNGFRFYNNNGENIYDRYFWD